MGEDNYGPVGIRQEKSGNKSGSEAGKAGRQAVRHVNWRIGSKGEKGGRGWQRSRTEEKEGERSKDDAR